MDQVNTAAMATEMDMEGLDQRLLTSTVTRVQLVRYAMRGMNATEAAKLAGISEATARRHYADPEFRRLVVGRVDRAWVGSDASFNERTKSLAEKIEEQAAKSFDSLVQMLDPDTNGGVGISDNLKFRIHTTFLDRHSETAQISKGQFKIDPLQMMHAAGVAAEMDTPLPANVVQMPKQVTG